MLLRPHFTSRAGSTVEPSRSGGYDSETYRLDNLTMHDAFTANNVTLSFVQQANAVSLTLCSQTGKIWTSQMGNFQVWWSEEGSSPPHNLVDLMTSYDRLYIKIVLARYAPPPTTPLYLSDYCGEDCLSGDCDDRSSRAPSPTYHLGRDPPSPTTERSFFLNPCLPGPPPSPVPGPSRLDQSLGEGQDWNFG